MVRWQFVRTFLTGSGPDSQNWLPRYGAPVKIAFVDFIDLDYDVLSPEERPLGGSQSALCYLARAMAGRGHEVRLVNDATAPRDGHGVRACRLADGLDGPLGGCDVVVGLNNATRAETLRQHAPDTARIVLWTGHAADQPGVTPLADPDVRAAWDAVVTVSDWHRRQFLEAFGLDPATTIAMRNAIAPVFERLIGGDAQRDGREHVLTYTSTPFRGLHILLHAFPRIRAAVPQTALHVYSSMGPYGDDAADEKFAKLYDWARGSAGVVYSPAIPQAELGDALAAAGTLAYPNTFEETSCIAVMEAMAAGCRVVTTDRGALPETTAGHARLVAPDDDPRAFSAAFAEALIGDLTWRDTAPGEAADALAAQRAYVAGELTWSRRAAEWDAWLQTH